MRPRNYYRHYRGRRTKGKVALAVLMVLVILAALMVIRMQRHVVYDETGAPRLDVPWQEETAQEDTHLDLELVIQDPEKRIEEIHGVVLLPEQMTAEGIAIALDNSDVNAVVVPLKDSAGNIWFETATAVAGSAAVTEESAAALKQLTETCHVIGELNCFRDSLAADADAEAMGLMKADGFLFYDGENNRWLDPAKPAARQYLCDLAVDAAGLGVDEILLTGFGYPTGGQLAEISYGEAAKNINLLSLLEELQTALEPYGTVLSVELSADVIDTGREDLSGLILAEIAPQVDRVCAVVLPEEVEHMAERVNAAGEIARFVPILAEQNDALSGSWLLR